MSLSSERNSVLVNSTSTMPVQLTKLVMSASVTVRPIVLNCRPTGRSSKKKPRPTVSTRCSPVFCRRGRQPPPSPASEGGVVTPSPACGGGLGWGLNHPLVPQAGDLGLRQPEPAAIDLSIVLTDALAPPHR